MYTQCPECQTAFRVTARVLQQAGGRVRCGGCGSAFSALDYLSEEPPLIRDESAATDVESQRKKLLETLDQLAGPENVVIEDTGVEWQVLDEVEGDTDATGQHDVGDSSDTGSLRWMLEDVGDESEALPEIVDEIPIAGSDDDPASAESVMRFDDNTPLPDDFDDIDAASLHSSPQRRDEDRIEQEARHFDEMQIDLALGEPDEWVELLDEVEDDGSTAEPGIPLEVEEEIAAIHNELTSRSGRTQAPRIPVASHDEPDDVESQFDSQADALGLDTTGTREKAAMADLVALEDDSEMSGESIVLSENDYETDGDEPSPAVRARDLESTGEFEEQIRAARAALLGKDDGSDGDGSDEQAEPGEYELSLEGIVVDEQRDENRDDNIEIPEDDDDIAELLLRGDLQAADDSGDDDTDKPSDESDESNEAAKEVEAAVAARQSRYPDYLFDENAENVETIILEGEYVHGSLRDELLEAQNKASNIEEAALLADTYTLSRKKIRGGRRKTDPSGFGIVAAVIVLGMLLAGQVMHNYRQTLSTVGAFNQTVAPIYRMLGKAIVPEWDITGWQFQATSGSTDEYGQLLTIFSTIANRSAQPLPYPLVHVSLTDRWEEIIGSRVLEPNEYLAGDLDPGTPVAAGDKFTAVISISSPSADATGFKLNVCYRVAPGRVRCATEDFKE